ncbi:MAG: sugar phosphate isomerase/epimerase [Rhodobacteraceae bacterium]|nr:sugar phosphate isomerase/epimerase [Paracoccaceae bacterium]
MPRLGVAVEYDFFSTLGEWIFKHDRNIEIQDFAKPKVLAGDTAPLIEAYLDMLDGYMGDIGIHGPFIGFDLASGDDEVREIVKKRLLQGLEVAEALHATHMVIHSPFTRWHTQNNWNFEFIRPKLFEDAMEALAPAIKRAEDIGCTLVLENINDVDPTDRRLLAEAINSPRLKLSVDTGHAQLVHGSHNAPPVDYFLKDAGDMLAHVHLQDADGFADRHWVPGEGSILWPSVFDAIAEMEKQPRLIIEVFRNIHRIPAAVEAFKARGLAC